MTAKLLDVVNLSVSFSTPRGRLRALDKVSFQVEPGEALALVGESGSGKSTAAMATIGLLGSEAQIDGRASVLGEDMIRMPEGERRRRRGVDIGIVFQDPFTSLNPSLTIGRQIAEALIHHRRMDSETAEERVLAALEEVGMPDPQGLLGAYPHQLSGGMQQRVLIASALVCDPKLLILDEPTTALDVTVEARILDLLDEIRRRRQLGMLFITHNLGVVNRIADRVCVLYAGRIAETGEKVPVLSHPAHPYTKGLLGALPRLEANEKRERLVPIPGRLPDLTVPLPGCVFQERCPFSEPRCAEPQALVPAGAAQAARCWKADRVFNQPWPRQDVPARRNVASAKTGGALVAKDLSKTFQGTRLSQTVWKRTRFGLPWPHQKRREVKALDRVSLAVERGEVLGLVGESGSGKSTLGRALVRLLSLDEGCITFEGEEVSALRESDLRRFRSQAQIVFQNPDSSLNPRRTVGAAIERALTLHARVPRAERKGRVESLLDRVGLPKGFAERYPHQLSGGEKQRVGIARALATRPRFVLCDEPTSALDVSVQATVLNVLADLREQEGLSYLFISHDLSVVAHISDRIAVMYSGRIVETGTVAETLRAPYHPYTEALLSAIPDPDPTSERPDRITLPTDVLPSGGDRAGCPFKARCPRRIGQICDVEPPPEQEMPGGHMIACHIPLGDLEAAQPPSDEKAMSEHLPEADAVRR
jgi:peptide/nickel transport system ATP-binding protein